MAQKFSNDLSVGEMADRAGVAVSTLHYYEQEGLIHSWRTPANHRRYDRRQLRRVAVIRVAQTLGLPLAQIKDMLDELPRDKAVSAKDWQEAGTVWAEALDDKIELLLRLRDQLGACIGCGCLSLENCPLYNPGDELALGGAGPRRWTGTEDEKS